MRSSCLKIIIIKERISIPFEELVEVFLVWRPAVPPEEEDGFEDDEDGFEDVLELEFEDSFLSLIGEVAVLSGFFFCCC